MRHAIVCDDAFAIVCDDAFAIVCDDAFAIVCDDAFAIVCDDAFAIVCDDAFAIVCDDAGLRGCGEGLLCRLAGRSEDPPGAAGCHDAGWPQGSPVASLLAVLLVNVFRGGQRLDERLGWDSGRRSWPRVPTPTDGLREIVGNNGHRRIEGDSWDQH